MRHIRNKEVKQFCICIFVIAAILSILSFSLSIWAGIMVLITAFLMCIVFQVFTLRRYKNLSSLSEYLKSVSSGDYSMDIRDNKEGELSILKSEIYKVTLMLTEYNERLQRDKILLSNQMAEISHQLKTPLTSMMMMVDLLQDENLPVDKRHEFTNLINAQLGRFDWLVSSLLKMSKLDAGVIKMKKDTTEATRLIDSVVSPFLIPMELKGITHTISADNLEIVCDEMWTREALINILKNCIEHTHKGGHICLSVNDNTLFSEIIISDNGAGIRREDLPHIFTRFYRGKNASSDSVGIGLAMSYSIIKSQQGDIQVKSELGKGSSFAIRLYKSVI
ncbi:MAG: HAMP domain-containing histidine kinase [Anaerolineaceae bacterium]|nr:MAG: HAMP domain-containing histidine kinase [Anaerolineaceae bacterium]